MKSKAITISLFASLLCLANLQAQEAIPASGGEASGSGGSSSYTIGQVSYITSSGSNGSVAEGVQQPYEISVVTGIKSAQNITLNLSAYPNPTTNFVILDIDNQTNAELSYQLIDLTGKNLKNEPISSTKTQIDMSQLLPAVYFLRITNQNQEIKLFRIIKL